MEPSAIGILAHNVTIPIDSTRLRINSSRYIDRLEPIPVEQESMVVGREVEPNDRSGFVDTSSGGEVRTRKINGREAILAPRKSLPTAGQEADAHDLAGAIDSIRLCVDSAGKVDGSEPPFA